MTPAEAKIAKKRRTDARETERWRRMAEADARIEAACQEMRDHFSRQQEIKAAVRARPWWRR